MRDLKLRGFVAAVVAAATGAVVAVALDPPAANLPTAALLALLACLAGLRPVMIPALRAELGAIHPFIFCALALCGPRAALVAAVFGVLGMTIGRGKRPQSIRLAFNFGAVLLSTALAIWLYRALGGAIGEGALSSFWPLSAACAAYFLANTGLVSAAISLDRNEPIGATWKSSFLWTAVTYFFGLTLSVVLLLAHETVGPWAIALGIPPSWFVVAYYRSHKLRLEEQQRRIEEVEALNEELEGKVAARTREIEEANRRLTEANERLRDASRAKSEFLANMSHELRTPLNAILGFSELLADGSMGELDERRLEFVRDIHDSGEHLLNLINDILDLSKIEVGRLELHRSGIDVPEVLREATAMLRPQAGKKRIAVELRVGPALAVAEVDPGMFRQILVNLLSNAVKFTPEGGRVSVEADRDGRDLVVHVRDTGIGIAPEDQERVFQSFFQVDGSYSRQYQGTGLGLALVRQLVTLHGGMIGVESERGKGACFTCRFPACVVDRATAAATDPAAVPVRARSGAGRTVLVVEDNAVNRRLARNALRSRGYRVLEAASAEEGLRVVGRERPDLVLMDLQLPGLDGLEATRRIKADPATAGIPVVALTAHALPADEERAREAGCCGYIVKPIRLSRFPEQIATHLRVEAGAA